MRKKILEIENNINRKLFILSVLVTIIAMGMMLVEFFTRGAFPATKISTFYVVVLLIYSLHKEALRWLTEKGVLIKRRGEIFVYTWIIITAILYLINFLTKDFFVIDYLGNQLTALSEITITTLEICAVFIFSRIVKIIFNIFYLRKK